MLRLTLALALAALPMQAFAFQSIYIVRHAEKQDSGKDPDLSPAGQARAANLSRVLKDAKISAIFTTEYKRTKQTAAKTAENRKLPIQAENDMAKLVKTLKADTSSGAALVVGHSNTVPELLRAFGSDEKAEIAETEFDKLFLLIPQKSGKPLVNLLHY